MSGCHASLSAAYEVLCDLQTRLDATETPNLNISKYLRGTWIRTGTIWSMLDPRRHPTINIAAGVAEGAVGTAKEYFGTRRQRSQLGVVEYVTKMVGEDGFLCEEALRFQSAGQQSSLNQICHLPATGPQPESTTEAELMRCTADQHLAVDLNRALFLANQQRQGRGILEALTWGRLCTGTGTLPAFDSMLWASFELWQPLSTECLQAFTCCK